MDAWDERSRLLKKYQEAHPKNEQRCEATVKTVARTAGHDLEQFELMTKDEGYAYSDTHLLPNKALVSR